MKLNMTKAEFIEFYNTHTYVEMQEILGVSPRTLARIVKDLGLSKPVGRRKKTLTFKEG